MKSSHRIKLQRTIDTVGLYVLIQNRNYTCNMVGSLFFRILHYDLGTSLTPSNSVSDQAPDCLPLVLINMCKSQAIVISIHKYKIPFVFKCYINVRD